MKHEETYEKALQWIATYTAANGGICVSSQERTSYPEVTGYYIPSLLTCGDTQRAIQYANFLCRIQKENGAWHSPDDSAPYVFDTAQILKGLISIVEILPHVEPYIRKGCDWVISNINLEGRLITPTQNAWGNGGVCSELVHLYCLSPLYEAGLKFDVPQYLTDAYRVLEYYKKMHTPEILDFSILSHFYAYVVEGLIDIGDVETARIAMGTISGIYNSKGFIPAYRNVEWICSTGLFQFSVIAYKLGENSLGTSLFEDAVRLQNPSGGWYGGYATHKLKKYFLKTHRPNYFPKAEISWASKYFLDAYTYYTSQ